MATAIVAAVAVQIAAAVAGSWWWLVASAVLAGLLVAVMHLGPGVLARASGAQPIERPALVERMGVLARRVRVSIESIDALPESPPATDNALQAGLGGPRRGFIPP